MYASVDLGGTNIKAALGDAEGVITAESTITTESQLGPDAVLARIAGLVRSLGERPQAIGVGVPGLVDYRTGRTLFLPNLPTNWRDVDVAGRLRNALGAEVYLLNDARMAALGELVYGHGRTVKDLVFFTLGTGIGGGVVLDGRLRLGPLGAAGEIGHQTVQPGGPQCGCGNFGCLEAVASAGAFTAEAIRLVKAGQAPRLLDLVDGDLNRITPRTMVESGDEAVTSAVDRLARLIGIGVANVVTIVHPEIVVLGGGMASMGAPLFEPVREEVRRRVRMFPVDNVRIEASQAGDKAGLLGGLALAARRGIAE